jgi:electron-transferring-flavoprotein dehydrogenase
MAFDVVVVGGDPVSLSAACRLMQLANESAQEISVVVLEKGSEIGAHILSGAILEPRVLDERFPDWRDEADHICRHHHTQALGTKMGLRIYSALVSR